MPHFNEEDVKELELLASQPGPNFAVARILFEIIRAFELHRDNGRDGK